MHHQSAETEKFVPEEMLRLERCLSVSEELTGLWLCLFFFRIFCCSRPRLPRGWLIRFKGFEEPVTRFRSLDSELFSTDFCA